MSAIDLVFLVCSQHDRPRTSLSMQNFYRDSDTSKALPQFPSPRQHLPEQRWILSEEKGRRNAPFWNCEQTLRNAEAGKLADKMFPSPCRISRSPRPLLKNRNLRKPQPQRTANIPLDPVSPSFSCFLLAASQKRQRAACSGGGEEPAVCRRDIGPGARQG